MWQDLEDNKSSSGSNNNSGEALLSCPPQGGERTCLQQVRTLSTRAARMVKNKSQLLRRMLVKRMDMARYGAVLERSY